MFWLSLGYVETSDIHKETNLCKWSHDHVFSMSTKTQTTIKMVKGHKMNVENKIKVKSFLLCVSKKKYHFLTNALETLKADL